MARLLKRFDNVETKMKYEHSATRQMSEEEGRGERGEKNRGGGPFLNNRMNSSYSCRDDCESTQSSCDR